MRTDEDRALIARVLGKRIERVSVLVDYGYRAAWRVEAGGSTFAVKVDTRAGFQEREYLALLRAQAAGVPVPEVVKFENEPVPTLVLRWLAGVPLEELADPLPALHKAGELMRTVHDFSAVEGEWWGDRIREWLARDLAYCVERRRLEPEIAERLRQVAESRMAAIAGYGSSWLHGDFQPAHILIDPESSQVMAIIDWGDAGPGDAAYDLTVLSMDHPRYVTPFLDGYGADAAFRERFALVLPIYRMARAAGSARWLDDHGYVGVEWPLAVIRDAWREVGGG